MFTSDDKYKPFKCREYHKLVAGSILYTADIQKSLLGAYSYFMYFNRGVNFNILNGDDFIKNSAKQFYAP